MTIYKYVLEVTDRQTIETHYGELLCVQIQSGVPMLWALVDTDTPKIKRMISTFGTGNPVPEGRRQYIDTYQMSHGALVWHVFEELK